MTAAVTRARVTGVSATIVDDLELQWLECGFEALPNLCDPRGRHG
jgi:hypothetical protein